jgi:hypothetical protein
MAGICASKVGICIRIALSVLLLWLMTPSGQAQAGDVVCRHGFGHFATKFSTGVTVDVGPAHQGGFAQRNCQAALSWRGGKVVVVASAAEVDIDVLGADLGLRGPVVAFETWKAQGEWQAAYQIYSLDKSPKLLKTITGGDQYRAIDADFNKRVAIWTRDAAAVTGLDGLTYADFDAPPTVVLNFEHRRLIDVSAWYRRQYDEQIIQLRARLTPQALAQFQKSDEKPQFSMKPAPAQTSLQRTEVKVLEIVCAYLYSGRPQQAWAELNRDWPPADVDRIRAEILAARAKGIDAQVAGVASAKLPRGWTDTSLVHKYLLADVSIPVQDKIPNLSRDASMFPTEGSPSQPDYQGTRNDLAVDTAPQAILVWRPQPSAADSAQSNRWETMMLTTDEAGKVHAAKMVDPATDPVLIQAAKNWRFIPAFRGGKPVAYKLKFMVKPYR